MAGKLIYAFLVSLVMIEVRSETVYAVSGYAFPNGISTSNPLGFISALQQTLNSHFNMIPANARPDDYQRAKAMFDATASRATGISSTLNGAQIPANIPSAVNLPGTNIPSVNLPAGTNIPSAVNLPAGTTIPSNLPNYPSATNLPAGTTIPSNLPNYPSATNLPGGAYIPSAANLPGTNPANFIPGNLPHDQWMNEMPLPMRQILDLVQYVRQHCPLCQALERAQKMNRIPTGSYAIDSAGNIFQQRNQQLLPSNYAFSGPRLVDTTNGIAIVNIYS